MKRDRPLHILRNLVAHSNVLKERPKGVSDICLIELNGSDVGVLNVLARSRAALRLPRRRLIGLRKRLQRSSEGK
ncbi:hypothetical protein ACKI1S_48845, partial [Streptomyces galilaeus]